jgi:hypothetical protein
MPAGLFINHGTPFCLFCLSVGPSLEVRPCASLTDLLCPFITILPVVVVLTVFLPVVVLASSPNQHVIALCLALSL